MPSHSPPLALNHCWDNEGNPPHPTTTILLPLPDPQTDTSFIEILWCSNPQLPPGAIMDSLRQPFPARLSSKPAWVTSPPLLLEEKCPSSVIPVTSSSSTGRSSCNAIDLKSSFMLKAVHIYILSSMCNNLYHPANQQQISYLLALQKICRNIFLYSFFISFDEFEQIPTLAL